MRTTELIPQGTFVVLVVGQLIDATEAAVLRDKRCGSLAIPRQLFERICCSRRGHRSRGLVIPIGQLGIPHPEVLPSVQL